MSIPLKVLCVALIMAVWGALVVLNLAPVDPFVTTLRDLLITLGAVSVALTEPRK